MRIFTLIAGFLLLSATAFSQPSPPADINGSELRNWYKQNWYDGYHNQLGYDSAREQMYGFIDNATNSQVYCVYTGFHQTGSYSTYLNPINCEHTVPQSFFSSNEPMKSDIHHLYPTHQDVNSARGSLPFDNINDNSATDWYTVNSNNTGIITTSSIPASDIEAYSKRITNISFEPREDHKGDVARSIFYFYTMYPSQAGSIGSVGDIEVLYEWHLNDPPDAKELQRNERIEETQGNRNPYVDYPETVCRAWGLNCLTTLMFTSTPVTTVEENQDYLYQISVEGEDGNTFTIECPTLPGWINFNQTGNTTADLSGTPNNSHIGDHDVSLSVTDGNDIVYQNFVVSVTSAGTVTIFEKDFEDQSLSSGGWTSHNILGNQVWEVPQDTYGHNNSYCAKISGYDDGSVENEDWFISPAFNPDGFDNITFSFWNTSGFDGPQLRAYYSVNYAGDPTLADWTEISGIDWHDGNTAWEWTFSQNIDLSMLAGEEAHIAFKYLSTSSEAATWEIDDILLKGEISVETEQYSDIQLKLYPNPGSSQLFVEGLEKETDIQIISVDGRILRQMTIDPASSVIEINYLPNGIYFIRIQKYVLKFIKQ